MLVWWVRAGWILDFQYCKRLSFLHYFFKIKQNILFYFINIHFPNLYLSLSHSIFIFELKIVLSKGLKKLREISIIN